MKSYKHLLILVVAFSLTLGLYFWFIKSPYFGVVKEWSEQNAVLYFSTITFIKAVGVVWPPLPGSVITLGSIPILGWKLAFFADFIGSMIGTSMAYYLGLRYGHKILKKLFDHKIIDQIKAIKIKGHRELEATFVSRLTVGRLIPEALSYASGVLGVGYGNLIAGSALSHIATGVPTFYLVDNIVGKSSLLVTIVLVVVGVIIFVKFRGRYIE